MRIKIVVGTLAAAAAVGTVLSTSLASGATRGQLKARDAVVVSTRQVPKLGRVLVNGSGRTLYMFVPDKQKRVTCKSTCARIWPPLKLTPGAKTVASGGVKAGLIGSDADPSGGRVVTYNRWPLYTYAADTKSGVAYGQALNANGGLWYVLAPSGAVIKKKL
jgi:predicted lipoprotein with Yx(FWY)xxD motif